jgi:hypothetical protein
MSKVILFNRKVSTKDNAVLKFAKNQDNYLNTDLNKIEFLSNDILKKLSSNSKVNKIFVLKLMRKSLRNLDKNRKNFAVNKKLNFIKKQLRIEKRKKYSKKNGFN